MIAWLKGPKAKCWHGNASYSGHSAPAQINRIREALMNMMRMRTRTETKTKYRHSQRQRQRQIQGRGQGWEEPAGRLYLLSASTCLASQCKYITIVFLQLLFICLYTSLFMKSLFFKVQDFLVNNNLDVSTFAFHNKHFTLQQRNASFSVLLTFTFWSRVQLAPTKLWHKIEKNLC